MLTENELAKIKEELGQEIAETLEKNDIPGLALSLVGREGILWTEGFGHTDKSHRQKATPDSLFNLQSSGKAINAVAFLRGVQRGVLKLDDKLKKYYPELRLNDRWDGKEADKITFRHLLSHHAGLTHEPRVGGNWDNRDLPFEELVESINDTWMVARVGEQCRYANTGMSLAMYGLQRASGVAVKDFVRQEVIEPLGMDSMVYGKPEAQKHPEYVTGYSGGPEALFESLSDLGAGCQYVSLRDISRFVQMQLNDGVVNGEPYLDPDLLEEMRTVQFTGDYQSNYYGLGLFISPYILPGSLVYGHAGGGVGYAGQMMWSLEHGVGVIVELNDEDFGFAFSGVLARKALRLMVEAQGVKLPEEGPPTFTDQPPVATDPAALERLEGTYVYYATRIPVKMKEGDLTAEVNGKETKLTHHGDLAFTAEYPPGMKFFLDEAGKPSHLMWMNGQGEFHRFHYDDIGEDEPGSAPEELDRHVGLYQALVYGFTSYMAVAREGSFLDIRCFLHAGKVRRHAPGVFFGADGEPFVFEGEKFWFGNRPAVRIESPLPELRALSESDPQDRRLFQYSLLHSLTPMLKCLGREDEAAEALELCCHLYPDDLETLSALAEARLERGSPEEARKLCERMLEIEEGNPEAAALMKRMERAD